MDESALSKHSVAELKDMLRSQGLAVSGNKSLLIQRASFHQRLQQKVFGMKEMMLPPQKRKQ